MPAPTEIFNHWQLAIARLTDVFKKGDATIRDNFEDGVFPGDDWIVSTLIGTATYTESSGRLAIDLVSTAIIGEESETTALWNQSYLPNSLIESVTWEVDFDAIIGAQNINAGIAIGFGDVFAGIFRRRDNIGDAIFGQIRRVSGGPIETIRVATTATSGKFGIVWDEDLGTVAIGYVIDGITSVLASWSGFSVDNMNAAILLFSDDGANVSAIFNNFEITFPAAGAKRIQRSLIIYSDQIQELETIFFQLLNERDINNAIGAQLDVIGVILNLSRKAGQSDASYRAALRAQIEVLKSAGEPERLIRILDAIVSPSFILLQEYFPGALTMTFAGTVLNREELHDTLQRSAVGGVRIDLIQVDPDDAFAFEGPGAGLDGFGNLLDPTEGGLFSTLVE